MCRVPDSASISFASGEASVTVTLSLCNVQQVDTVLIHLVFYLHVVALASWGSPAGENMILRSLAVTIYSSLSNGRSRSIRNV